MIRLIRNLSVSRKPIAGRGDSAELRAAAPLVPRIESAFAALRRNLNTVKAETS